jgi:hypothetical protein
MHLIAFRVVPSHGEIIDAHGPDAPAGQETRRLRGEMRKIGNEDIAFPASGRIPGLEQQPFAFPYVVQAQFVGRDKFRMLDLDDPRLSDDGIQRQGIKTRSPAQKAQGASMWVPE